MEQKQQNPKIFDDYEVDCNECGHYWLDACDGVPIENKRNCTSFVATRTSDIPKQIKQLREELTAQKRTLNGFAVAIILLAIGAILHILC